jgi:TonB-linked SusC/RagA family outer membrane protein
VQQLNTSELTQTAAQNLGDLAAGKVSGVQITGSGTQGGSTHVVIRGENSITGSNEPLYIVDGVPVNNNDRGGHPGGGNLSYDFGSAVNDINPNDIESMSVLKGPSAAALYGSRAANGVVIITTKKGLAGASARVELNTTYTWDRPSILPDYQNQYGQGAGGQFRFVDGQGLGNCDGCDQSWGPKLDGRLIDQFTGKQQPWIAHPDNVSSFFNTGHDITTNLAVSGGTDRATARLSVGRDNVDGYIPNNFFQKTTGLLTGAVRVSDRFSTTATLQYIHNKGVNRPAVGYSGGILEQFVWFGRQIDMNALRQYQRGGAVNGGPANREFNWNYNYHNNPFWMQYENPVTDTRDRFIGTVSGTYRIFEGLNLTAATGSDIYNYGIDQRWAQGNIENGLVDASYYGAFQTIGDYSNENNTSAMLQADRQLIPALRFNGTFGGNVRRETYNTASVYTSGISVAGIYNVSNAAITPTLGQYSQRRQVNAVYGSAAFTLNNWWTVEGTARNDWSSTLPKGNNSYFYPSVNTSVVVTDAVPALTNSVLSYLKLRASAARVGNDAPPYQLRTTYAGNSNKFAGLPQFTLSDVIANPNLKPEITTSSEGGLELGLFSGRATLDASLYHKSTKDQIINIAISPASGFTNKSINAGRIDNNGFEALLTVTPIQMANGFQWSSTFNYARNQNKVVDLAPGINTIVLGGTWYATVEARKGRPYGEIIGNKFLRDSATGKLLTRSGLPLHDPVQRELGNIQPRWTGGWANTLSFKHFTLYGLLDMHVGGQILSISNFFQDNTGVIKRTLKGRQQDWDKPGIVVDGIDRRTCKQGSHTAADGSYVCVGGTANTTNRTAEDYFQSIFPVHEPYIYNASWVKLREVRLGVDLPQRWANRLYAQNVNIALIGRNLWTSTNVPNIDPEFSYSTGNFQGIEFAALPNPRSIGLSLRLTP